MPDPLEDLGPLLAQRRAEQKLSLRDVSEQSRIPTATLSRIEQGRTPDLATFRRLVMWLGIPPEDFFNPTERSVSTPDAITGYLRLDPSLAPDDANKIGDLVRTMYNSLRREDRQLAVHLRAAKTFTPPAMQLLDELLVEMQVALEACDTSEL
jgi:transcriptional regulator with XRE-family HTH domain